MDCVSSINGERCKIPQNDWFKLENILCNIQTKWFLNFYFLLNSRMKLHTLIKLNKGLWDVQEKVNCESEKFPKLPNLAKR